MKRLLARLRELPAGVRWGGLLTLVLLAGLGVWFFFLRQGSPPPITPPQRPALGKTVTLADYKTAIQDAHDAVKDALASEGDVRKAAILRAIADLGRVEGASVINSEGGNALAEADNTRLLQELAEDNPDLKAVESGLALLTESLEGGPAGHLGPVEGTLSGAQKA